MIPLRTSLTGSSPFLHWKSNNYVISPSELSPAVLIKTAKMAPVAFLPLSAVLLKSAGCLQSKMAEEESADTADTDRQPAVS